MKIKELFDSAERLRADEKLEEALTEYQKVVDHFEEDDTLKAESLHMIGIIYLQIKDYEAAKFNLEQSEKLFKGVNNFYHGAVLRDLAALAVEEHDIEKAEKLLRQSIAELSKSDASGHLGISKVKLGTVFQKQGKFSDAENNILEGLELIKHSDDRFFESSAYYNLAKLQKKMGQLSKSKLSAKEALALLVQFGREKHLTRKNEIEEFISTLD